MGPSLFEPTADAPAAPKARKGRGARDGDQAAPETTPPAEMVAALPPAPQPHYVVLARKYRPQTFADLIGQEAMVRTLRNAFATGRIAQAYMLTGVRGVGKTTTARILARALNFSKPGSDTGPTIDLTEMGEHCQAIMESRHPDVIEMDAASNTGIENVREIIESARYRPVAARTKVYIIDEVHMLSKAAFNGLLKTLEEPPPHVKFIFATTEVRKVPVTVLSRCQRFDLRRVETKDLAAHFRRIAEKEGVAVDDEALMLIARAAGGSVRDGLSILDQAFASGSGGVTGPLIRSMLGLSDRGRILDLLDSVLGGDAKAALGQLDALYKDGADPVQVIADLAEAVHAVTRVRVAGEGGAPDTLSSDERVRVIALAGKLGIAALSRAWQMLVKGLEDAGRATDSRAAAEMVLIRMAHSAELPSPDEVLRKLAGAAEAGPTQPAPRSATPEPPVPAPPLNRFSERAERPADAEDALREATPVASTSRVAPPLPQNFEELIELVAARRDALLKIELEERVRLVSFDPPRLELNLLERASPTLASDLAQKLAKWTGQRWMVALSRETGAPPLGEVRREREARDIEAVRKLPAMAEVLKRFPDAEITHVRPLDTGEEEDSAAGGEAQ